MENDTIMVFFSKYFRTVFANNNNKTKTKTNCNCNCNKYFRDKNMKRLAKIGKLCLILITTNWWFHADDEWMDNLDRADGNTKQLKWNYIRSKSSIPKINDQQW